MSCWVKCNESMEENKCSLNKRGSELFSSTSKPQACCVWKSSAHSNPSESRLRGCRMCSTTWRNSPWGIDYWTSCLRKAKVTAEVPAAQWPRCFGRAPGFVHVDVTLYTSQGHLAPVAHSCYSHYQPRESRCSPQRAPPGFVITPALTTWGYPIPHVSTLNAYTRVLWEKKKSATSVFTSVVMNILWNYFLPRPLSFQRRLCSQHKHAHI